MLASPLGGLSLDSLVVLRAAARAAGWELWRVLERGGAPTDAPERPRPRRALPDEDAERLRAFVRPLREPSALAAPRISLETLIDRAVTGSGYDRARAGACPPATGAWPTCAS